MFTQYGYARATGGFLNGHDFEIAIGAPMHWGTMVARYVNWLAAVPVAVYAVLLVMAGPWRRSGDVKRFVTVAVLTVAVHSFYAASLYAYRDEEAGLRVEQGPPLVSPQWFARSATMFV